MLLEILTHGASAAVGAVLVLVAVKNGSKGVKEAADRIAQVEKRIDKKLDELKNSK